MDPASPAASRRVSPSGSGRTASLRSPKRSESMAERLSPGATTRQDIRTHHGGFMLQRVMLAVLALLLAGPALAAGGVVSAADPRAAAAGRDILRAGGSATDAAIAMMLALNVVEPQSSGIGGGGFLVHAGRDGATTIDGRETAPASARPDRFLAPDGHKMAF